MQGKELASRAELSAEEIDIVDTILLSKEKLTQVIPDDSDPNAVWKTLTACCKALAVYRNAASTLKLVVGRMLVYIQDHPDMYIDKYPNFNSFVTTGVPELFGVARSEAFAAKRLVEAWPSLTVEEIKDVKFSKLAMITRATGGEGEKHSQANRYLRLAQDNTLDQLQDILANSGVLPREESDLSAITILTNKGIKDKWLEFIGSGEIQSYVGSDSPGTILECLMAECEVEWRGRMLQTEESNGVWRAKQ